MKKRRANGEGSVYEFIQKIKRKDFKDREICSTCKNCLSMEICNNREDCKLLCDKCKRCTDCLKYCDRYYIYERNVSQATKKDGTRTSPQYAKKRKDAAKNNLETINKINTNTIVDKSKITLYDIAKSIIDDKLNKNITTENSYITNTYKLKRLSKHDFMHKPAQEVTDLDIHNFLNHLTTYSDSVISKDYGLLKAIFIKAVRKKILSVNPLDDKDEFMKPRAKVKSEKVTAFTLSEQKNFLECIKKENSKYKKGWLLMNFLGLRPGEVFALNIYDIDFDNKKIHIRNTLTKDKSGNTILGDTTKTYSGNRVLDMDTNVESILKEAVAERIPNPYNLIFWDDKRSNFMSVSTSNSAFKRFCEKNNISKGFNVTQYILRHSFATRQIESGVPVEILKNLMGHKDIDVTLNAYFDAFAEYKNQFKEKSEKYFKENKLNYTELSREENILTDLNKINEVANASSLDDLDKKMLNEVFSKIKDKYNLLE